MPNLNLPTNITPGTTATFEADVEAAWAELNLLSRDTGNRDISSSLIAGRVSSGRLLFRRKNDRVRLIFDQILLPAEAEGLSWQILAGTDFQSFRPDFTSTHDYRVNSAGNVVRLAHATNGNVFVQFAKSGASISTVMETYTSAGWPTTLPGVAA